MRVSLPRFFRDLFGKIKLADPVAQSVEHLTFNQGVMGSSPIGITRKTLAVLPGFFVLCPVVQSVEHPEFSRENMGSSPIGITFKIKLDLRQSIDCPVASATLLQTDAVLVSADITAFRLSVQMILMPGWDMSSEGSKKTKVVEVGLSMTPRLLLYYTQILPAAIINPHLRAANMSG